MTPYMHALLCHEDEAWTRLIEIADNPVTTEKVDTFALQAITSVNKSDIIKRWREQLMTLLPVVQHETVPFHERFLSTQFKEEASKLDETTSICIL